jgi:ribosomal-protein-alanine N-acetyltransferase
MRRFHHIFNEKFPTLDAGPCLLREMQEEDAPDYFEYHLHPDVRSFITAECLPETPARAAAEIRYNRDLFAYKQSMYWGVADKGTDRLIGSCGFNYWNKDHNRAEISYDLAREYWGRGVMSETVRCMLRYGFSTMELHRVEATVPLDNVPSLRVLEKNGFRREGVLRDQKLLGGRYRDMIMLSLLAGEFEERNLPPDKF